MQIAHAAGSPFPDEGVQPQDCKPFASLADLFGTFALRKPEIDPWIAGAQINRDRNLRIQYLAGISLNVFEREEIYRDMVRYRSFPEGLFIGSLQQMFELRMAFAREGDPSN